MEIERVLDAVFSRTTVCGRATVAATVSLAVDIAREGYEGRPIGTLFTIGRAADVLANSRPLILDPLAGHSPDATCITDQQLRGTVKELALLDGAFVIDESGHVVAGCRYIDVDASGIDLPLGLGSRHIAAASVSKRLGIVAVAVSASGIVRVFCGGDVVATIQQSSGLQ